jgi:YqiJ-like protein
MSAVIDTLLAADVRPFAVAAAIMVVLAGIELLTTMAGFSISHAVGKEIDFDAGDNAVAGLVLWFNEGRVPLLIVILLTLGIFSIEGFFLQGIAHGVGIPVPAWIAALAATAGTIPVIRITSRGISRIIPRDETYVVNEADFVGRVAIVSIGPLDQGLPGRVRLKDVFGNWHTVPARASHDSKALAVGASVLLVDHDVKGFIAISAPADLTVHPHSSDRA